MKKTLHDLASLAARMGVGGIFFANGWQKLEAGLNATQAQFTELHAPVPYLWAAVTMLVELVGGTLLIAGLAVPAVGLLLFAEALAVFVITAGDAGLPLTGGAIELIVALGAASVLLAVTGGGRVSVDHMVVIKRREAEAAGEFAADAEADAVIAALRPPWPGETHDTRDTRDVRGSRGEVREGPEAGAGAPDTAARSGARPSGPRPGSGSGSRPGTDAPAATAPSGTPADPAPSAAAPAARKDAAPSGDDPGTPPSGQASTTTRRTAAPRPRRTRRDDDTTTESRAEAPPAR
ncbi:DoxX family protein [Microbispora cellulosiformans]|uniref:DoxX family protein n=1 Tax=Microbispora cellulosiformans TaxID=2614688 RepID=A0A5J5K8G3_9ACTN|nr:DoxX family protein [Microbispora cellulosiformans]KAA9380901.1 DoxX family protein [Microbispora cellulosiformans]